MPTTYFRQIESFPFLGTKEHPNLTLIAASGKRHSLYMLLISCPALRLQSALGSVVFRTQERELCVCVCVCLVIFG